MTEYIEPEQALAALDEIGFHVRDAGLLFSALARPAATAFGDDAYPGLEAKTAALLESLTRNHPLFDGNKRFAWYMTLAFLRLNGYRLDIETDTAFDLVVGVAAGRIGLEDSAARIARHLTPR